MAWYNPKSWIKRKNKKQKKDFPYHYIRIIWTESAVHDGMFDDYNKEIQRVKGGEILDSISYTESDLEAIKYVYKIPVVDLTEKDSKVKFEFESMGSLSGSFSEVIQ